MSWPFKTRVAFEHCLLQTNILWTFDNLKWYEFLSKLSSNVFRRSHWRFCFFLVSESVSILEANLQCTRETPEATDLKYLALVTKQPSQQQQYVLFTESAVQLALSDSVCHQHESRQITISKFWSIRRCSR